MGAVKPEDLATFVRAKRDAQLDRARSRFERLLWWLLEHSPFGVRIIYVHGEGYLLRGQFTPTKGFVPRVYLHYFLESDQDRELHNHPFPGVGWLLTHGYSEYRWVPNWPLPGGRIERRDIGRWCFNVIRSSTFHRVELSRGRCWTLFVSGLRVGPSDGTDWGFLDPSTRAYTPWGKHKSIAQSFLSPDEVP